LIPDRLKTYKLTYKPLGKSAILIEWPPEMNELILKDVLLFYNRIQLSKKEGIVETIQSINSLTIIYDFELINFDELNLWLKRIYPEIKNTSYTQKNHLWKIPVCYDTTFGLDLSEISVKNKLSIQEIIRLHTGTAYRIYSIGFLPGFLYLGGLEKQLHINRKSKPRLEVPKGAVGIGGVQTGIYPKSSPGGWQILGNTPINFFDISKSIPCFAKPGDKIQFIAISYQEHVHIQEQVTKGVYLLEKEVLND